MTLSLEDLKRGSRHLRGELAEDLANAEPGFSDNSQHLLKPHGLYQQKNRDHRKDPVPPPPAVMARGRIPGGCLSGEAWLAWDDLATRYGDGTLRITTRQSLELHGVLKGDVKATLQGLKAALQTTTGACGDVVRNVVTPPNPAGRPELYLVEAIGRALSDHYKTHSRAYAEIFLDGEAVDPVTEVEPIYGETYLPRKFKFGLTVEGENAVDLFTHDVGLAATFTDNHLEGWHVFAGGGMGMSHGNAATFPRLADHLGWVPAAQLFAVTDAVVKAYRDFGNRENRKRARLKYVLHERGVDWFRAEVEARSSVPFVARGFKPWSTPSHLGWQAARDGSYSLGFHTLSGRVSGKLREALREAIQRFDLSVQLTPEQDLILVGASPESRTEIAAHFESHGLNPASPSPVHDRALACVALPWCSLAIAEAERVLPDLLKALEASLRRHDRLHLAPTFRITGCANGCARPYAAELALVGQAAASYTLWAGGTVEGTELAFPVSERLPYAELPEVFDRLIGHWAAEGDAAESFGAFARRQGAEALAAALHFERVSQP